MGQNPLNPMFSTSCDKKSTHVEQIYALCSEYMRRMCIVSYVKEEDRYIRRDRRERFVTLAEARTSKALLSIRLIGNLSNRSNYQYTDQDVNRIIRALNQEIADLKRRFKSDEPGKGPIFKIQ